MDASGSSSAKAAIIEADSERKRKHNEEPENIFDYEPVTAAAGPRIVRFNPKRPKLRPVVAAPEIAVPVVAEPEIAVPVVAAPIVAEPEIAAPVVAAPVVAAPEIVVPVVAAPIVAEPEIAAPIVAAPEIAAPVVAAPVVAAPEIAAPAVAAPEIAVPVVAAPEIAEQEEDYEPYLIPDPNPNDEFQDMDKLDYDSDFFHSNTPTNSDEEYGF